MRNDKGKSCEGDFQPEDIERLELFFDRALTTCQDKRLFEIINNADCIKEVIVYNDLLKGLKALELERFQQQMAEWESSRKRKKKCILYPLFKRITFFLN